MPTTRVLRPSPVDLVRVSDGGAFLGRIYGDEAFARVRAGVYAPAPEWSALKPWERYLARVHAYALIRPDAVFAFESAGALRGAPVYGEPRDIHIFDSERKRSVRFGDVSVHTSADGRSVERCGPLHLTSVADTIVDQVRVLPPAFALAIVDGALRNGDIGSVEVLSDLAMSQRSIRGRRRMEWVWPRADGRSESVGESVSRAVVEWWGFPEPELQRTFWSEGAEDRVDFFWPKWRTIGESDGYGKYAAEPPRERLRTSSPRRSGRTGSAATWVRWLGGTGATRCVERPSEKSWPPRA